LRSSQQHSLGRKVGELSPPALALQGGLNVSPYGPGSLGGIGEHGDLQLFAPIHLRLERNPRVTTCDVFFAVLARVLPNPEPMTIIRGLTLRLGFHVRLSIDLDQLLRQDLIPPEGFP